MYCLFIVVADVPHPAVFIEIVSLGVFCASLCRPSAILGDPCSPVLSSLWTFMLFRHDGHYYFFLDVRLSIHHHCRRIRNRRRRHSFFDIIFFVIIVVVDVHRNRRRRRSCYHFYHRRFRRKL